MFRCILLQKLVLINQFFQKKLNLIFQTVDIFNQPNHFHRNSDSIANRYIHRINNIGSALMDLKSQNTTDI